MGHRRRLNTKQMPWAWGAYSPMQDDIVLATHDEQVFFHELAHGAHARVLQAEKRTIQGGQHWDQEIIAELAAVTLARCYGREVENAGQSYKYIQREAAKEGIDVHRACLSVLKDVQKVLNLITEALVEDVAV